MLGPLRTSFCLALLMAVSWVSPEAAAPAPAGTLLELTGPPAPAYWVLELKVYAATAWLY